MQFRHVAAAGLFVGVALAISWPLPLRLSTHLPGGGIGDNVQFLWNFWWMRTALASGADFFWTPFLFAPYGTDLTLHTHTALPAFAGATVLGGLPLVAAHNVTVLLSLALNGVCGYLVCWRLTRDYPAALLGGLAFAASPYVAAHLNGHFNLTNAWTVPLFVLALQHAGLGPDRTEARSPRRAGWAGLVLGLTAYIDYYYVVYQVTAAVLAWGWTTHRWTATVRGATPSGRMLAAALSLLAGLAGILVVAIALTGGFRLALGPLTISARTLFNPLQIFWVLVVLAAFSYWRPAVRIEPLDSRRDAARSLGLLFVVSALVALPVLLHGAALVARGEYVTQQYFWRSAPRGVDIGSLVLGHPFHGLWGGPIRAAYESLGIDVIESLAWVGVVPLVLAGYATWRVRDDVRVGYWTALGGAFFVWALGPHLTLFGVNTGLVLPQTLLRYLPIAANARVPGRAMIVVALAVAALSAMAAASWRRSARRGAVPVAACAVVVFVELLPAPFPVTEVESPPIYAELASRPDGGVLLELPLGTRDGFQTQGALDHRVLAFQTLHGRPIVGGFVARLSPEVIAAYEGDPLLGPLLRASSDAREPAGSSLPDSETAGRQLAALGIRYVMLNRETAPAELIQYVDDVLPLRRLASGEARTLYVVDSAARN